MGFVSKLIRKSYIFVTMLIIFRMLSNCSIEGQKYEVKAIHWIFFAKITNLIKYKNHKII
jgi:hypothetical protein